MEGELIDYVFAAFFFLGEADYFVGKPETDYLPSLNTFGDLTGVYRLEPDRYSSGSVVLRMFPAKDYLADLDCA